MECLTINAVYCSESLICKINLTRRLTKASTSCCPDSPLSYTHSTPEVLSEVLRTHLTVVIPPVANPSLYNSYDNSHETSMCVYCACLCAMYHQPLTDLHYLGFGANQVLARSAGHCSSIIAHNCDTCLQPKEH